MSRTDTERVHAAYARYQSTVVYWMLVLVLGIVAITVITERAQGGVDLFVLLLACMMLVMQFVHLGVYSPSAPYYRGPRTSRTMRSRSKYVQAATRHPKTTMKEGYSDGPVSSRERARQSSIDNGEENVNVISGGLTVYASSFSSESYPDAGGKLWRNVQAEDRASATSDPHFHFRRSPAFSRRDGFKLSNNTIAGPYSFQLGIKGDMTFSVFVLCQFSGELPDGSSSDGKIDPDGGATVFRVYANTPGNNGVSLVAYEARPGTSANSAVRSVGLQVQYGQDVYIDCQAKDGEPLEVEKDHKYLIVLSKTTDDRITVRAIDVHSTYPQVLLIADRRVTTDEASAVDFSNKDMTINEKGNFNAHLQVFGCYDRAMSERDVVLLYDHYKAIFEKFDPTYVRLMDTITDLSRIKECPFNARTCAACESDIIDGDWGNAQNLITASTNCRKAVGTFCSQNPKHPRCTCWSVTHPEYKTRCKTYRCIFGNDAECKDDSEQTPNDGKGGSAAPAELQAQTKNTDVSPRPSDRGSSIENKESNKKRSSAEQKAELQEMMASMLREEDEKILSSDGSSKSNSKGSKGSKVSKGSKGSNGSKRERSRGKNKFKSSDTDNLSGNKTRPEIEGNKDSKKDDEEHERKRKMNRFESVSDRNNNNNNFYDRDENGRGAESSAVPFPYRSLDGIGNPVDDQPDTQPNMPQNTPRDSPTDIAHDREAERLMHEDLPRDLRYQMSNDSHAPNTEYSDGEKPSILSRIANWWSSTD